MARESTYDQACREICEKIEAAGYKAVNIDYSGNAPRDRRWNVSAKSPDNNVCVLLGKGSTSDKAFAEVVEYLKGMTLDEPSAPTASTIVTWNTDRQYSEHGQRMAATQVGDVVYFVDIDRGIDGMFHSYERGDESYFRRLVMSMYDSCSYFPNHEQDIRRALENAVKSEAPHAPDSQNALIALAEHVLAMEGDSYLNGHPEFNALVDEARLALAATKGE